MINGWIKPEEYSYTIHGEVLCEMKSNGNIVSGYIGKSGDKFVIKTNNPDFLMIDFFRKDYSKDAILEYLKNLEEPRHDLSLAEKDDIENILKYQEINNDILNYCKKYLKEQEILESTQCNFRYKPAKLLLMEEMEKSGFEVDRINEVLKFYLSKYELRSLIDQSTSPKGGESTFIRVESRLSKLTFSKNLRDNYRGSSVYLNNKSLTNLTYFEIPLSIIRAIRRSPNSFDILGKEVLVNPAKMVVNMKSVRKQKNFWRWLE